jgi:phosphoribosylaminoimidazolecarboxamide formyltransferase / IMP cyclohydrolase
MARALISVSDKTGLLAFARGLATRGFELVSTGGTARVLQEANLAVTAISEVTGFPEMMDGRVKTLHPMVHGGILARRDQPADLAAATAHGITLIDLVVVNLYPFVKAATNPDTPFEALIEEIDIGGPSLLRAAAKNFQDVLVVVSPSDYPAVLEQLDRPEGPSKPFRFDLAQKAFAHTGGYDTAIASTLATVRATDAGFARDTPSGLPAVLSLGLRKVRDLRYGENPHQMAALYHDFGPFPGALLLQGKELSYTNLLDLDAAGRIVIDFAEPAAAVIKHMNPCGAATGADAAEAYVRAREADPIAAFGGIIGLNRPVDAVTAEAIVSTFIEAVFAPAVDSDALTILARKPNLRVIVPARVISDDEARATYDPATDLEVRSVLGGVLVQARDYAREAHGPWPSSVLRVVTKRQPTDDEWQALRFAWRVSTHVKSNAVIFTLADRTLAIGAGQMSRVDAVRVATMKAAQAGIDLKGSVAASDAFFPFRDGIDVVAATGASAIVQPGGSMRDQDVIDAADEHGLTMVFTGRRHFRH